MPTLNILPMIGKHLTSVVLTGQTVNASTGVLSDGSSATLSSLIDGLDIEETPEHEEINALNTTRRNKVIVSEGWAGTISVFKVNNGSDPNPLRTLCASYDYFKAVWVEGTVTGGINTYTLYFARGTLKGSQFTGRGKTVASLEGVECDIGGPQLTVVVS